VEKPIMTASELPTAATEAARRPATAQTRSQASAETGRISAGAESPVVLGRYRLHRRLGTGAFGTVWVARDERLDRDVAVKILPRERIVGGRFEREARAAARLAHPGIVTLYEAAVDDDDAYLVSELVVGATLDRLLEAGRLSDRDIVAIGIALCDALSHAHEAGVVHRDVKPSNVLIPGRPASAAHPAKLTDFGVARIVGGDSLTRTGDVVGTAAYMAPEQAEGREAGAPADLYALALVTYEALTGVNPVRTGASAVRARRLGAHLPPLRRQRRDLPRELGRGIDLALRPRPRERGTVEELRDALSASLSQVGDAPGVVATAWPRSAGDRDAPAANDAPAARPQPIADHAVASPGPPWPARALAATGAAAAAGWLAAHLLAPLPIAPAGLAMLAWIVVLILPRVGWLALTAALVCTAAAQQRPGGALVILIAALVPVVLLPLRAVAWPLSAAAPALGLVGLAGAWPALAARAGSGIWRRAALGATGWLWLVVAAPLAGADLYVRRPAGIPAPHLWTGSLSAALHDVVTPISHSGALAGAPVWALAAAVLPWLIRGRSLAVDLVLVTVWAATLVSATEAASAAFAGTHSLGTPPTAVLGAIASGLVALWPSLLRALREGRHSRSPHTELP
jgi:tRNA A-37 threonylcarbamoyl transferase component Bud32